MYLLHENILKKRKNGAELPRCHNSVVMPSASGYAPPRHWASRWPCIALVFPVRGFVRPRWGLKCRARRGRLVVVGFYASLLCSPGLLIVALHAIVGGARVVPRSWLESPHWGWVVALRLGYRVGIGHA